MAKKNIQVEEESSFQTVVDSILPDGSPFTLSSEGAEKEAYRITCGTETIEKTNGLSVGYVTAMELAAGFLTWEEVKETGTLIQ